MALAIQWRHGEKKAYELGQHLRLKEIHARMCVEVQEWHEWRDRLPSPLYIPMFKYEWLCVPEYLDKMRQSESRMLSYIYRDDGKLLYISKE